MRRLDWRYDADKARRCIHGATRGRDSRLPERHPSPNSPSRGSARWSANVDIDRQGQRYFLTPRPVSPLPGRQIMTRYGQELPEPFPKNTDPSHFLYLEDGSKKKNEIMPYLLHFGYGKHHLDGHPGCPGDVLCSSLALHHVVSENLWLDQSNVIQNLQGCRSCCPTRQRLA